MTVPDYQLGVTASAKIGTTTIKGINSIVVPGIERGTVDVVQFSQDFDFTVPVGAKWTEGKISGNYVGDDLTGQVELRDKLYNNEGLTNLRLYEDATNFWAPDLANNEDSVIFVKGMPGPEISKNGIVPFSASLLVQGLIAFFDAHISGATLAFTVGTITDSGSGFVTAGFEVGDTIIIDGSTSCDDAVCLVTVVAVGTLTVSVISGTLTAEAALAGTTVHGGSLTT